MNVTKFCVFVPVPRLCCTLLLKVRVLFVVVSGKADFADRIMFPIKVLKLFQGYDNQAATAVKHVSADKSEAAPVTDAGWPETDRRSRIADRRQQDRRMQQVSILLNTRKAQGRRHSGGRRKSDHPEIRYSFSVKG